MCKQRELASHVSARLLQHVQVAFPGLPTLPPLFNTYPIIWPFGMSSLQLVSLTVKAARLPDPPLVLLPLLLIPLPCKMTFTFPMLFLFLLRLTSPYLNKLHVLLSLLCTSHRISLQLSAKPHPLRFALPIADSTHHYRTLHSRYSILPLPCLPNCFTHLSS